MSTSIVLLVLASAFVHASWNAILKRFRAPEDAVVGVALGTGFFGSSLALAVRGPIGSARGLGWCVLAGALEAAYFASLARALARAGLGVGYTVSRGGALLLVWPVSVALLGEEASAARVAGTALVFAGLVATGFAPAGRERRAGLSGVGYALLTAVFIAGYNLAYKMALREGTSQWNANGCSLGLAGALTFAAAAPERRRRALAAMRAQPAASALAGLLATSGFVMFLSALSQAGAGVVFTLRNTSILFAQGFAFALGERPRRLALLGAALVTAGAVLLTR